MRKVWKPPSSQPILIYFEFWTSLHSLLSFAWTLTRPTNNLRQNIVFSCSEIIRVSFSLFLYFSFLFLLFYVIINFYKNYFIIIILLYIFFHENYFYFFMFRNVPECSGMLVSKYTLFTCICTHIHDHFITSLYSGALARAAEHHG